MTKMRVAAIIVTKPKLGLLNCIQLENEKDEINVVQMENRWKEYYIDNAEIKTFYLDGTKSEFLHNWHNPTKTFLSKFENDKEKTKSE